MLQQPTPDDYVVATGETHSVREFLDERLLAHRAWIGTSMSSSIPRYFRPTEVDHLLGDASKARTALGWKPRSLSRSWSRMMVEHDLELARQEKTLIKAGHRRCVARHGTLRDSHGKNSSRIFVAGHRGLVGSAICPAASGRRATRNLMMRTHDELDLTRPGRRGRASLPRNGRNMSFWRPRKWAVSMANTPSRPSSSATISLIQTYVIDAAWRNGVAKMLFLGSSCIYPEARAAADERGVSADRLPGTDQRRYAIAKIAGLKMAQAYRQQYGFDAISLMPTNLYGPGDNFDLESSHVLPALMRRFHEAKLTRAPRPCHLGNRLSRREFLHVDDLAGAALFLMNNYSSPEIVNVGTGREIRICDLALLIAKIVGFEGTIIQDSSKPDGTPRKLLDVSRLRSLGWEPTISLAEGIRATYEWYAAASPAPSSPYAAVGR